MFTILLRIDTFVFIYQVVRDIFSSFRLPLNSSYIQYEDDMTDFPPPVNVDAVLPREVVRIEDDHNEYETDVESEYDVEEEYADIEYAETIFEETDKTDGKYYLGVPFTFRSMGQIVMNCSISSPTFLSNDYSRVVGYLQNIASFYVHSNTNVEILQLHITEHGEYTVVVKTFWLRIIQRRWKNVLKLRAQIFAKRASVKNQEYFRIHGRYLPGTHSIPGLHMML